MINYELIDFDGFETDNSFSNLHRPLAKKIIDSLNLSKTEDSSRQEDTRQATDLVIRPAKIGLRAYRPTSRTSAEEFTMRSWRASGTETEFKKIIETSNPKYYIFFYNTEKKWKLVDMDIFRSKRLQHLNEKGYDIGTGTIVNKDGITGFRAFRYEKFGAEFIVYQGGFDRENNTFTVD